MLIHRIVAALSKQVTADEVADAAVRETVEAFGAFAGALFVFGDEALRSVRAVGYPQALIDRWTRPGTYPVVEMARAGKPSFTRSRVGDPKWDGQELGEGAACMVPLTAGGRAFGCMTLSFDHVREFPPEERETLVTLGAHCAQSLERALLFEAERSARAAAESARRELEGVLDHMPVAVAVVRATGRISVNRQAQKIYNTEIRETRRSDYPDPTISLKHPDGRSLVADEVPIVRALRGEVVSGEELIITQARGEERLVRVNAGPVRDESGKIPVAVAVFTDVTDETRLQRELLASERRHRAVLQATNDVIWELDGSTGKLWCNDALETVFGYHPDETNRHPEGGAAWWAERIHPEDRPAVEASFYAASRSGEAIWSSEYRFRRADGTFVPTLDRCVFERDAAGNVVRTIGSMTDVGELRRLLSQLRDAVRVRDDFLSIAGHELRTPLAALSAQLVGLRIMRLDDEARAKKLLAAERQTRRLKSLVDQLLDVSRIVDGKLQLVREELDLSALVREVAARLADDFQRGGTPLDVSTPGPIVGRWDRLRVDLVVTNLLTNALRYGERRPVAVKVTSDEKIAGVMVEDHGMGIRREDQERIFDRFARAVESRQYGGLGVGLWLARQIAIAHEGSLTVESEIDRGARFLLVLPR